MSYRSFINRKTNRRTHPETGIRHSGSVVFEICLHGIPAHGIRFSDRKCVSTVIYRECSAIENMRVIAAITGLHYSQAASLLPGLPIKDLPGNPADGYAS